MAVTNIDVLDGAGVSRNVNALPGLGTALDAASLPSAFSTEGKAQIGSLTETAPATDTASSGLNGRLQRIAQRITTLISTALNAGENHVGETGANITAITTALTGSTSPAYSSGDVVDGKKTLAGAVRVSGSIGASGTGGYIIGATLNSKSAQTAQFDVILFGSDPSGSTFTDNAAIAVVVADFAKVLGVVHITDWTNMGTTSVGQASAPGVPISLASATSLYAVLVVRGTPTLTATTDLSLTVFIERQ